ncbi:5-formyltetrahydrofolate cyclo-ligase [Blattabacterium cuenoti]|uniref:5-formyltetrahydrofolate cyclo-ligase n=1 Tax=Blattabacterium cuenoti TaxID=1653831 RepID=UPI00163C6CDD|nr:5-formyltetrahydrofolate cyclo-ligase [Blattabacterium cuenoti]
MKKKLRKKYFFYRKSLTKQEVLKSSYDIFIQVKKLFFIWEKTYYHIFLPIKKYNEINTFLIANFLFQKGKYITVPYSNFHSLSIENCLLDRKTTLKNNKYGIPEPVQKYIIPPSFIEVIFIPLLVFDLKGYRIGYGKGFYDRFLTLCKKNVLKIGLSFFNPIDSIPSIHKNDLMIDIGITRNKVFFLKNFLIEKNFKNIPNNNHNHHQTDH